MILDSGAMQSLQVVSEPSGSNPNKGFIRFFVLLIASISFLSLFFCVLGSLSQIEKKGKKKEDERAELAVRHEGFMSFFILLVISISFISLFFCVLGFLSQIDV